MSIITYPKINVRKEQSQDAAWPHKPAAVPLEKIEIVCEKPSPLNEEPASPEKDVDGATDSEYSKITLKCDPPYQQGSWIKGLLLSVSFPKLV